MSQNPNFSTSLGTSPLIKISFSHRYHSERICSKVPITSRPPYLESCEQCGENVHLQRFDAGGLGRLEAVVEVEQHLEAMLLGGAGEHLPEDEDALVDEGDAEGEGQACGVRLGAVQPAVVVLQGAAASRAVLLQLLLNELVQLVLQQKNKITV